MEELPVVKLEDESATDIRTLLDMFYPATCQDVNGMHPTPHYYQKNCPARESLAVWREKDRCWNNNNSNWSYLHLHTEKITQYTPFIYANMEEPYSFFRYLINSQIIQNENWLTRTINIAIKFLMMLGRNGKLLNGWMD